MIAGPFDQPKTDRMATAGPLLARTCLAGWRYRLPTQREINRMVGLDCPAGPSPAGRPAPASSGRTVVHRQETDDQRLSRQQYVLTYMALLRRDDRRVNEATGTPTLTEQGGPVATFPFVAHGLTAWCVVR